MNPRQKYKTRQREILIDYLVSRSGSHITAGDVCGHFREQGISIGQSTVYRQLESLVDEGVVNKYVIDANTPACFEYSGEHVHKSAENCYHCKCEKCGKLIHLKCGELETIQAHLFETHRFKLNTMRTVFYGLCDDCIGK